MLPSTFPSALFLPTIDFVFQDGLLPEASELDATQEARDQHYKTFLRYDGASK